jgi:hypothetical protein
VRERKRHAQDRPARPTRKADGLGSGETDDARARWLELVKALAREAARQDHAAEQQGNRMKAGE